MRIAFLTNSFPPQRGGAATIASAQADALRGAGHMVRIWCPPITWFSSPAPIRFIRHLADLFPSNRIVRDIADWNPDILLTHNLTGCGFGTASVLQRNGIRWLHILHDVQLFEPSGRITSPAFTRWQMIWSFLRRRFFGRPDLVVSPTRWLLEQHKRRGFFLETSVEILPNPAPEPQFVPRMPQEPMQLLLIGSSREKGVDFATQLVNKLPFDVVLHLIGTGIPRDDGQIIFHGGKETSEILEMMKQVDALLVPSTIAENQPTVILEAASVGLPVVAADIGGIAETLDGSGLLCPSEDFEAWKDALLFLRDAAAYGQQAASMYELARRHDPVAYASALHQLISNL